MRTPRSSSGRLNQTPVHGMAFVHPRYPDPMPPIRAVLFDLDGVIRRFDPENVASIERNHDLAQGSIQAVAFAPGLIEQVTAEAITRSDWVARIGAELRNAEAVEAWGSQPFHVDEQLSESGVRWALGLVPAEERCPTDSL